MRQHAPHRSPGAHWTNLRAAHYGAEPLRNGRAALTARRWLPLATAAAVVALVTACGGGSGSGTAATPDNAAIATFIDSPVQGLAYQSVSYSGRTDGNGNFPYKPGETVTFSIGNMVLGSATPAGTKLTPLELVPGATDAGDARVTRILRVLQSLNEDDDLGTIEISDWAHHAASVMTTRIRLDDANTTEEEVKQRLPMGDYTRSEEEARQHFEAHKADKSNADLGYDSSQSGTAVAAAAIAQPANTSGRLLASNCFQCHGTLGRGGFESIRGGEASEVREYLSKTASGDIMAAHAQGYTRAQLNAIVSYLQQK